MAAQVILIPCNLSENVLEQLPSSVLKAVHKCSVLFVENERTARRFLKQLDKSILIENFEWFALDKHNPENWKLDFKKILAQEKTIGIMSESGCPGVADPGAELVSIAQQQNIICTPIVGPNSIILALMASGLNGQKFCFNGYLPIDNHLRKKELQKIENDILKTNCTHIFIETPYRNIQFFNFILEHVQESIKFCVASNVTGDNEFIKTKSIKQWKSEKLPDINKIPTVFLLG